MPSPANVPEFLLVLRQSGLVEEAALRRFFQQQRGAVAQANAPMPLAKLLVRGGLLTPFQAEHLLQGKWRRFTLGRYIIQDQIGAGGMATVYLCQHKHMKRKAAVKVLPWKMAADPSCLARFYREARALADLDHPNIVRAYDVAEEDGLHFLAMEYVEVPTLHELIKVRGPLGALQAMHYMRQAASGLQHAYEHKLIHRDIKPGNLLVDLSGTIKVLDLGLARFFNDEKDDVSIRFGDEVLGTADYLAPEAAINCRNADIRSDIYGLGCTFYFCLTGRPPFPDGTVTQKLLAHQTQQPPSLRTLRPDLPKELTAVVERMMAKRPQHRFQTPAQLANVLNRLLAQSGETAVGGMEQTLKESSRWRKRHLDRWWRRVLATGIALLVAGVTMLLLLIGWLAGARKTRPNRRGRNGAICTHRAVTTSYSSDTQISAFSPAELPTLSFPDVSYAAMRLAQNAPMPRTARAAVGGYHVLNERAEVFHGERDYHAFVRLMWQACARVGMRLLAYCLMPIQNNMGPVIPSP